MALGRLKEEAMTLHCKCRELESITLRASH